jgi:hypothetical protein
MEATWLSHHANLSNNTYKGSIPYALHRITTPKGYSTTKVIEQIIKLAGERDSIIEILTDEFEVLQLEANREDVVMLYAREIPLHKLMGDIC